MVWGGPLPTNCRDARYSNPSPSMIPEQIDIAHVCLQHVHRLMTGGAFFLSGHREPIRLPEVDSAANARPPPPAQPGIGSSPGLMAGASICQVLPMSARIIYMKKVPRLLAAQQIQDDPGDQAGMAEAYMHLVNRIASWHDRHTARGGGRAPDRPFRVIEGGKL
jgi:hypothetical protein